MPSLLRCILLSLEFLTRFKITYMRNLSVKFCLESMTAVLSRDMF